MEDESSKIDALKPIYFPNEESIVRNVFIPVANVSSRFDCMSGYFSASVLKELAEPLAILFRNKNAVGRFIISPNLSDQDKTAILEAYKANESMFQIIFSESDSLEENLRNATLDALKFLINKKKIDFKVSVMKQGMMHAKFWLFYMDQGVVSVHGSGNATQSGLMRNFEQLALSRNWVSKTDDITVLEFEKRFDEFWNGRRDDCFVISLNNATMAELYASTDTVASEGGIIKLLEELESAIGDCPAGLNIPKWLEYQTGDYAHQGDAIDAWNNNGKNGVLEIATGGGKTLTSLICASLSLDKTTNALIIIAVPTNPLIKQWCEDVRLFGLEPIDTEGFGTAKIVKAVKHINRKHRTIGGHDAMVVTHDTLKNDSFLGALKGYQGQTMLIGDEVHNLGVRRFVDDPPEFFDYKLGLSATPERQYDLEGTTKLFDFFGKVVFEFPLSKAIGNCLVPFNYYVHQVFLDDDEVEKWQEYSEKIRALSWSNDPETKKIVEQLLIRRRSISEGAINKVKAFMAVVQSEPDNRFSLAFCTDKDPEQLKGVNDVLREVGILFHQVTGDETSSAALVERLISSYKTGGIEMLTSKRVLDEGFNIPPIKKAYFLASSGTRRTWVQRLGRVLRLSKDTDKEYADVHDFIVRPIDVGPEFKPLIKSELERMQWFSSLSMNGMEKGGSVRFISDFIEILEGL